MSKKEEMEPRHRQGPDDVGLPSRGEDSDLYSKCSGCRWRVLSKGLTKSQLALRRTILAAEQEMDLGGSCCRIRGEPGREDEGGQSLEVKWGGALACCCRIGVQEGRKWRLRDNLTGLGPGT